MTRRSRPRAALVACLSSILIVVTVVPARADGSPSRVPRAEELALRLLNCTRTGGWVRADGSCRAWGSGRFSPYRAPLARHAPIALTVAWPWALQLVITGVCNHSAEDGPSWQDRFRSVGHEHLAIAENIGCASGLSPRRTVIATHRAMQAERASNGGHWENLKSADFRSVGIGVARLGDRTAVVYDFTRAKAP